MGFFKNILGGKVKTGSGFKSTYGEDSLHKLLMKAKYRAPSTMANVSTEELGKLEKLIGKYAKNLSTGSGFSGNTKYRMKQDVYKLWRKDEISEEDMKDFKKIIDAL
jgi:hypothetical protein